MTDRRHNGGPLNEDDAKKLWGHIRAIETLNEQIEEVKLDVKERKDLAKKDGFDTKILEAVVKRRKIGHGETTQADELIKLYEQALEEQKALPLEQTQKRRTPEDRRTVEEIDEDLHGDRSLDDNGTRWPLN